MSYERFPNIEENSNQVLDKWKPKYHSLNFQPDLSRLFALEQADMCCLALQCMSIFAVSIMQIISVILKKVKVKVPHITGHEGPEGE